MGQRQFGGDSGLVGANSKKTQKRKRTIRSKKSDEPYVFAITNPVFLDWEHRMEGAQEMVTKNQGYVEDLSFQHTNFPIQLCDFLFLSNALGVIDVTELKALGITHVLNVGGLSAAYLQEENYRKEGICYKMVSDAVDEPTYPMLQNHLQECNDFIDLARFQQNPPGKCVVHCHAGSNRSGVIVASILMITSEMNVLETVLKCRQKRGNAFLTNPGFAAQLVALARQERSLGPPPGSSECVVEDYLWRKMKGGKDNR